MVIACRSMGVITSRVIRGSSPAPIEYHPAAGLLPATERLEGLLPPGSMVA
jgi:hypothetical protein